MLACPPGEVTLDPPAIVIPADQEPLGIWPWFEHDARSGHQTITARYVATRRVEAGGAIRFGFGYPCPVPGNANQAIHFDHLIGPGDNLDKFPLGRPQVDDPAGNDFVVVRDGPPAAQLSASIVANSGDDAVVVEVRVGGQPLKRNQSFRLFFGDRRSGGPGATLSWHPGRLTLVVEEDVDGDGLFELSPDPLPELLITAGTPQGIAVNLPVSAVDGRPFAATLEILQGRDEPTLSLLPCWLYSGSVRIGDPQEPGNVLVLDLTEADRGVGRFQWTFRSAGIHRLRVEELAPDGKPTGLASWSNPVDVRTARQEMAIYVGDLHRHAAEGGHAGATNWRIWQELRNSNHDFGAVMEHTYTEYHGFLHQNDVTARFQAASDPSEQSFIAFPGYEWTLAGSHRHVVLKSPQPELSYVEIPYRGSEVPPPIKATTLDALLTALRALPSPHLAIAHHPLWEQEQGKVYEWGPLLDDPLQPVVEIFSDHGSSERRVEGTALASDYVLHGRNDVQRPASEKATIQDALEQGRRVGFVGGSDNHTATNRGTFVTNRADATFYGRGGLTFVAGERSTASLRDRIWDGINQRRTWVTTGARIYVDWHATAGGQKRGSGSEITGREVTLHLRVVPSGIVADVVPKVASYEIWRDGTTLVDHQAMLPAADELDVSFRDDTLPRDGKFHSYYARVVQDDDHVAWASPIWAKRK